MIDPMLFSSMKATLKLLIESLFVDSVMIELDLNDDESELTKVSMCHMDLSNIYTKQTDVF